MSTGDMSARDWHVPEDMLREYGAGCLDPVQVMSVEAHLPGCPRCRAGLTVDPDWLATGWERLAETVARPRLSRLERLLRRSGVPEHHARLLAATPTLSRAWLTAVAAVLGFAVVFAYASQSPITGPAAGTGRLLPFLLAAPVLPLAGIAVAYGPRVDPAYEMLAATPLAGARLLLLRASAVLVAAAVPAGLAAPLLPGPALLAAAWLLPALTLTTACLALATRLPVRWAAGGLMAAWVSGVLLVGVSTGERLLAFGAVAQLGYLAAALLLAVVVFVRRRHFDPGEARWYQLSTSVR